MASRHVPGERTPHQRTLNRAELPKLLRRGYTYQMIAEQFGINVAQVASDWEIIVKEVMLERNEETKQLVAKKLEELAEVKREAWRMWELSKAPFKKRSKEEPICKDEPCPVCSGTGSGTRGDACVCCAGTGTRSRRGKLTRIAESSCGDVRYLKIILNCIEQECKLQALYPMKGMSIQASQTLNWEVLARGIPAGPVPDDVEEELEKAANNLEYRPILCQPPNMTGDTDGTG
jgi:hypothetical protein